MKHYVIGAHGHVMVGYNAKAFEVTGVDTVKIPANVKVAAYIPPGSEFGQKTGISLQTRVLFGGGLADQSELDTFMSGIKGGLKKKELQKKTTFFGYSAAAAAEYPKICTSTSSHDLYNYTLQGPQETDIQGFLWGVYARGTTGPKCIVDLHSGKTTMAEALKTISTDAGSDTAVAHCVFCRVEVLDESAKKGLDPSVKSNTMLLYQFDL